MTLSREKILKDLKRQEEIEGLTDNIKLLRRFLENITTSGQWSAFTGVKWHRYGPLSYEAHRFWYASGALLKVMGAT